MRIGELASALGVSADTVRYYERNGWLPSARRRDNGYREYSDRDAEHLRLLVDLRRMELPLESAAQIASWCHTGHCDQTTSELPRLLTEKRREIAERIAGLQQLDERLADLERHLRQTSSSRQLQVVDAAPCCPAAATVTGGRHDGCAACA